MRSLLLLLPLVVGLLSEPALAFEGKPKLGPNAVPITQRTAHLRSAPAPDYWMLSPFYEAQRTSSDCSVASVTMAVNFLRGLPAGADEPIVTENRLLSTIGDAQWANEVAEGGSGVTFSEFVAIVNRALAAFRLQDHAVEVVRPTEDTLEALADLRQALAANEPATRTSSSSTSSGRTHGRLGRAAHLADRRLRSGDRAGADHGRGPGVVRPLLDFGYRPAPGDTPSGAGRAWSARRRDGWSSLDQARFPAAMNEDGAVRK